MSSASAPFAPNMGSGDMSEGKSQTTVRLCAAYHENGGCYPAWACDCIAIAEPDRHTVERLNAGLEATTPATSQTTPETARIAWLQDCLAGWSMAGHQRQRYEDELRRLRNVQHREECAGCPDCRGIRNTAEEDAALL